jgi:hypothetical protein
MAIVGWTSRFVVSAFVTALVIAGVSMAPANAQQSQSPAVSAFLANPGQLLQQNPNGGSPLSDAVQTLALADNSTFKTLIGLTTNATDQQKAAIGAGLAQATKIEVLTNQALATDWQQQIAAITDPTFKIAATNAFGDVQLGSVGGGSLGAAGSGLGGPGNGSGSSSGTGPVEGIQSTPTTTSFFTVTSSTTGASSSVSP